MTFYRKKSKVKTVIITTVVVLAVLAVLSPFVAIFANKSNGLKFSLGSLDASGNYVESNKALYTKDAFEFDSIKVTRDFEANVKYQLFFYDELDQFVSSSESYTKTSQIEAPEGARFARIVIEPIFGTNIEDENKVVKWYEIDKYVDLLAFDITIEEAEEEPAE